MALTIRPGITLKPGVTLAKPLPPVAYAVDSPYGYVAEGDTMTVYVTTTAVADGTVLYWTLENVTNAPSSRWTAATGSVTVTAGTGSFGITPLANLHTDGAAVFRIYLRTGSATGPVVAQSPYTKTIGDTSLTPPVPSSGQFNQPESDYLSVAQPGYTALGSATNHAWSGNISSGKIFKGSYPRPQVGWIAIGNSGGGPYRVTLTGVSDGGGTWDLTWASQYASNLYMDDYYTLYDPATAPFNLGTTWTVEFSIYMNYSSNGVAHQQGGIWGVLNQNGWATRDSINVALSGGLLQVNLGRNDAYNNLATSEPVPQQWVHVAIVNNAGTVKVYYNGAQQVQIAGPNMPQGSGTGSWTNSTDTLFIGALGNGNSYAGNSFDGKITNLRITDRAEYTTDFTPTLLPVNIPGHTRLLWTPSDQTLATDTSDTPHTITNSGVTVDSSYPAANSTRGSADFGTNSFIQVGTAGSTPWALGTTWTIEWWQKATNATTVSGLYSVMGQHDGTSGIDIYYQNGYLHAGGMREICAEPPAGLWTHVAMVTSNGSTKVYYNGIAQSVNAINYNLQDSTLALYIGCRGNNLFQNFIGKLTNIRITDTEVYTTDFVPDQLPTVIADHTKLLYTPTVDTMYRLAAGGLPIATRQVAYTAEYPHILLGIVHPYNGGSLGTIYCLAGDPKLAAFQAIPVGAKITSNISGFGTRTVGFTQANLGIGWAVIYDPTGLTGVTSDTDTFNFYWD